MVWTISDLPLTQQELVDHLNQLEGVIDGFSPSGTFSGPFKYIVLPNTVDGTTYYSVCDAYQTIYGGASDAGSVTGTDATAVIQAALSNLSVGRTQKETILLKGDFGKVDRLTIYNYTRLIGLGAKIQASDALNDYLFANQYVNGGGVNNDIEIEGIIFDGNASAQTGNYAVTGAPWFSNVTNFIFKHNLITNYYGIGGLLSGGTTDYGLNINCQVKENIWDGSNQLGVTAYDTVDPCQMDYSTFSDNYIILGHGGVAPYNNRKCCFTNNKVITSGLGAPQVMMLFGACTDLTVSHNHFVADDEVGSGIGVGSGEAPNTDNSSGINISDNTLEGKGNATGYGIKIQHSSKNITVSKNKVSGFGLLGVGFATESGAPELNSIVDGNICFNNGAYGGIYFNGYSKKLTLTNNICYDDQTPKIQGYGIYVDGSASTGISIKNNNLAGNKNGALVAVSIAGVDIFGNQGYLTENEGTATISAAVEVTFNHGLAWVPTHVTASVNQQTNFNTGSWSWTANQTEITIRVTNSGTYALTWQAMYHPK